MTRTIFIGIPAGAQIPKSRDLIDPPGSLINRRIQKIQQRLHRFGSSSQVFKKIF